MEREEVEEVEEEEEVEVEVKDGRGGARFGPRRVKDAQRYRCSCGLAFGRRATLREHQLVHKKQKLKPRLFLCHICSNFYNQELFLDEHLQRHEFEVDMDKCQQCPSLMGKIYLDGHTQLHENECVDEIITQWFPCAKCPAKFSEERYMKDHLKAHGNAVVYPCSICPSKYDSDRDRRIHEKAHYFGDDLFACSMCPEVFNRKIALQHHIREHMGVRPFYCPDCKISFAHKWSMRRHQLTHRQHNPKEVRCQYCTVLFTSKKTLKAHTVQMHSKQQTRNPWQVIQYDNKRCPICSFKSHCALCNDKHQFQMHSENKLFLCTQCPAKFPLNSLLQQHRLLHLCI